MSDLVSRVLSQRESWVDLGEGLRVRVRRPDVLQRARMVGIDRAAVIEAAIASAVGWQGFTEARILGPKQGSDSAVPFDAELWAVLAKDDENWIKAVLTGYMDLIEQRNAQQAEAEKN